MDAMARTKMPDASNAWEDVVTRLGFGVIVFAENFVFALSKNWAIVLTGVLFVQSYFAHVTGNYGALSYFSRPTISSSFFLGFSELMTFITSSFSRG